MLSFLLDRSAMHREKEASDAPKINKIKVSMLIITKKQIKF
ncbi:hypothetical protein ACKP2L_05675 [Oenococcus alcoholitolerans]